MAMLEDVRRFNKDLNHACYHDDSGCTTKKRRRYILLWSVGLFVGGLVAFAASYSEQGGALLFGAAVFLLLALTCPNGCCGEYSRNKERGCITSAEVKEECSCFFSSQSGGLPNGNGGDSLGESLLPGDPESGAGVDPNALVNLKLLKRYFDTYNSGYSDSEMLTFVRDCYAEDYRSTGADGKSYAKADLPQVFRDAWAKKRAIKSPSIADLTADHAEYSYTMTFAGAWPPVNIKAEATFLRPGVFQSVSFSTA